MHFRNILFMGLALSAPLVGASPAPPAMPTPPPVHSRPAKVLYPRQEDPSVSMISIAAAASAAIASALPSGVPTSLWNSSELIGTLNFPNGSRVASLLGLSQDDVNKINTSVLLIPSYANRTADDKAWNMRVQGLVYRNATSSNGSRVDDLISTILPNVTGTESLNDTERALLRNRTAELLIIPRENITVPVQIAQVNTAQDDVGGSGVNGTTLGQVTLEPSDLSGEVDQFVAFYDDGRLPNAASNTSTFVTTYAQGFSGPGNGTMVLAPPRGIVVVSDIDDVLRITKVFKPFTGLRNSFVEPYVNVPGMPELFSKWLRTLPAVFFNYGTTTPVQLTRPYVEYLFSNYPLGSLDMRPINLTEPSAILNARENQLERIFQTFPQRTFVLVGDTSSSTLLKAYPNIAQKYPSQLQCIFIRNTSATEPDDRLPYDTSLFANLNQTKYFFYTQTDDLINLDVANGQCVNTSIPQNLTFNEQGGILQNLTNGRGVGGRGGRGGGSSGAMVTNPWTAVGWAGIAGAVAAIMMFV